MAQPGVILEYYRPFTTAINDASHMLIDATTVVVDDASGFIVSSIIFIQDEQLKITAISSNTLTVSRAQNGTAAAQHNNDVAVEVGWIKAVSHSGNSAILRCSITKQLDFPSTAEIILSNRSKDPSSVDTAKSTGALSDATGERSTLFTEFQDVRIRENETGLGLFRGRIYSVRGQYDYQYGNTVKIIAKDMLQELADIPIDNETPVLKSIDVSSTYDSRSKVAAFIIDKLSTNFITTYTDKFETSAAAFTAKEKSTGDEEADGTFVWDVLSSAQQALGVINLLAKTDPHDSNEESKHFGYDYYVDANIVSSSLKDNANSGRVPMHWYKRGSRPYISDPAVPAEDIPRYGFTLEYPSKGWAGQTNFRKTMLSDAEFTNPNGAFFTSVVTHFEDTGDDDDAIANRTTHGVANFELVKGTIVGDFQWEAKRLQYIDDGDTSVAGGGRHFVATNSGATPPQYIGQSTNTTNPWFLFEAGQTVPCATVHFQSESNGGADNYLILSNVYKEDTPYTDPQGNITTFRAFPANPSGTSSIRLHITPTNHSTSSSIYFDIYNGARATERHDIHKPHRVQVRSGTLESYDAIRKQIASTLDRGSKETVTIAKVRSSRYPYTKVIARTTNFNNTRNNNVITFASNTFLAGDGSTQFNNPTKVGAKRGMVIAQLAKTDGSNSKIVRYAYISAINATTVTYGTGTTDTSDGTALDVAYDLAIIVPVEAGSRVRLKNKLHGIDYDILVQKLDFSYGPGILTTQIEGAGTNGINHNAEGVAPVPAYTVTSSHGGYFGVGTAMDKGKLAIPPSSQKITVDGIIQAYDHDHVEIPGNSNFITITTKADGKRYKVDKADGSTVNSYGYPRLQIGETGGTFGGDSGTTDEVHALFFRTRGVAYKSRKLQAIAVRRSSGSAKIYSDIATPDDIIVGTAKKVASGGLCIVDIGETGAFGSGWPMDVTSIGKHRLISSLSAKGAQHWSTDLRFEGVDYNIVRWGGTAVGYPASGSNATISFGDDETEAIIRNTGTTFNPGISYIYKRVGDDEQGVLVVTPTYSEVTTAATNRILMATVVVAADVGQESPAIFPIGANVPTISTGVLAARSIVAGDIKTSTITTGEIAFDAGDIGGNTSDNATIRAVAAATSGTIAGLAVSASTFYMGTGHYGQTNTPFFVRGVDGTDGATYTAGTASQSGSAVTGVGTTWLGSAYGASSLIGRTFTFTGGGGGGTITHVTDITHLTVSTSATIGVGTSYSITGYAGTAGDFSLGSKFTWDDSTSTLSIDGQIEGASSIKLGYDPNTAGVGMLQLYDENSTLSYEIRGFSSYTWAQIYSKPYYIMNMYTNTSRDNGWMDRYAGVAPGIADNYLGIPAGLSIEHGHGWAALILQRLDAHASFSGDNLKLGTVAITVPTPTEHAVRFPSDQAVTDGTTWDSQIKLVMPVGASFDFNTGTVGYQLATNGTGTLSWTQASSSLRYKENIRPLEIDSSKIYKLDPKSFNLIEGHISTLGKNTFGYIAEEVDKILPEVLNYDQEDRPDSLNYPLLTVFLVEELKKLRTRIEVLEGV